MRGNHRSPVESPHKGTVTRKMLPFGDVIMEFPLALIYITLTRHMVQAGGYYSIGYFSEADCKLKSCEISLVHNICFICSIVLKFCTEHDIDTMSKLLGNWEESYGQTPNICELTLTNRFHESLVSAEFRKNIPSNAANVSIWWRHQEFEKIFYISSISPYHNQNKSSFP